MIPLCGDACNEPKKILETKRDIPRINGSSGAFIAIVVCLVFVIIAAWAAILFLLRDQRAFDIEQARRPKRDQPLTTPHFSNTRSTWSSRITTFFARASQKINIHVQKRGGNKRGWAKADNWETDTGVSVPRPPGVREVASIGPSSLQNVDISHTTSTLSGSLSSVHLAIDPHETRGSLYPQMILPHLILPSIELQLSSDSLSTSPQSSNIHLPTLSSESIPNNVRFAADSREYVGSSGMIMRTLQGGTKFVEGL